MADAVNQSSVNPESSSVVGAKSSSVVGTVVTLDIRELFQWKPESSMLFQSKRSKRQN